jgi:ribA/ribD-fused uncharacterized protein
MASQHRRTKPKKDQPVFFYKPNESYGIFCQWYESTFTVLNSELTSLVGTHIHSDAPDEKTEFNCAEQFMMYGKAARFSDEGRQRRILKVTDPSVQKRIGKKVDGFDEENWTEVKSQVVELGSYAKFSQDEQLRSWLLGTRERELIEASGRDRVWGIGFMAATELEINVALENREHWGENRLGKALMVARTRIREEMARSKEDDSQS